MKVFENNYKKGFAQNRFQREQFKKITERTPITLIKQAYSYINQMLSKTSEKGDVFYDI